MNRYNSDFPGESCAFLLLIIQKPALAHTVGLRIQKDSGERNFSEYSVFIKNNRPHTERHKYPEILCTSEASKVNLEIYSAIKTKILSPALGSLVLRCPSKNVQILATLLA